MVCPVLLENPTSYYFNTLKLCIYASTGEKTCASGTELTRIRARLPTGDHFKIRV